MDGFIGTQGSLRVPCIGQEAGKSSGTQRGVSAHRRTGESLSTAEACWSCTRGVFAAVLDLANIAIGEWSAYVWTRFAVEVPLDEQVQPALPVKLHLGDDVLWVRHQRKVLG
jgi:hypothetical protein